MEQGSLFVPAVVTTMPAQKRQQSKAGLPLPLEKRKNGRLGVPVPVCGPCRQRQLKSRDWNCKACRALYQATWASVNPEAAAAAQRRANEKQRQRAKQAIDARQAAIVAEFGSYDAYVEHRREQRAERHRQRRADRVAANPERAKAGRKIRDRRRGDRRRAALAEQLKALGSKTCVYFFELMPGGPIKIGWTTQTIEQRLKGLRTGNPFLRCLATIPGATSREEKALHYHFERLHLKLEWFRRDAELLAYIAGHATPWNGEDAETTPAVDAFRAV